jgi:hypothetical protein
MTPPCQMGPNQNITLGPKLLDISMDVMVLPFFLPSRATKSHNTWTTTRVSAQLHESLPE